MQGHDSASYPFEQDPEMQELCDRYILEAANLPDPINSCPLHPQALPFERTMNGRLGCVPCLTDPFNLDADDRAPDGVDVDGGETRCPVCSAVVMVRPNPVGDMAVYEESGLLHTHRFVPFGQEARELRRGRPIEEDDHETGADEPPIWE